VAKSAFAAGVAWGVARIVTEVPQPVLASLTALVVVQVSVRASLRTAIERSIAVVLGVLLALAIGDAIDLNGLSVGLLLAGSLGVAQLVLRLPASAARQVPVSILIVLTTVTSSQASYGWQRALETVVGAAIGVAVSLILPASRLVDASHTLHRLAVGLGGVLDAMGSGLRQSWSVGETEAWRRTARIVRSRLVSEAAEAVGNSREAARWNVRDRGHVDVLRRYELVLARLERTAIGVSVISRGLDDHARVAGTTHRAMPVMGSLLIALADAVRTLMDAVLGVSDSTDVARSLEKVRARRAQCMRGAFRRARTALEHQAEPDGFEMESEWLGYAALLVQVDRIVGDLSAPVPA